MTILFILYKINIRTKYAGLLHPEPQNISFHYDNQSGCFWCKIVLYERGEAESKVIRTSQTSQSQFF